MNPTLKSVLGLLGWSLIWIIVIGLFIAALPLVIIIGLYYGLIA